MVKNACHAGGRGINSRRSRQRFPTRVAEEVRTERHEIWLHLQARIRRRSQKWKELNAERTSALVSAKTTEAYVPRDMLCREYTVRRGQVQMHRRLRYLIRTDARSEECQVPSFRGSGSGVLVSQSGLKHGTLATLYTAHNRPVARTDFLLISVRNNCGGHSWPHD